MAKIVRLHRSATKKVEDEMAIVRTPGFYKVRNILTKNTYGMDFEIAYWNGNGWTVLGWDIIEKNSFFEVVDENVLT